MTNYEYVRLAHCTLYYGGRIASTYKYVPPLLEDATGWLGLTRDGIVQFHTNAPLNGQRVTLAVALSDIRDVVENPAFRFSQRKCVRATLGEKDRFIVFSGLKKGVTNADRWIGRVPHVGSLVEAGILLAREMPGQGDRARDASTIWAQIFRGEIRPEDLEVVAEWPAHVDDVQPIVRRPVQACDGDYSSWKFEVRTKPRRNWFELQITSDTNEWVIRWDNGKETLTCTSPGVANETELTWRKTDATLPGIYSRAWWYTEFVLDDSGLPADLLVTMTREFGARPNDFSLYIGGHEVFTQGKRPPKSLRPAA